MHTHFGLAGLLPGWSGCVVCMGTFDGVHVGHREVVRAAVEQARERSIPAVVLTFDRHPAAVLRPETAPSSISTLRQNLAVFDEMGVDHVVVIPFTVETSLMPALAFFTDILVGRLKAAAVVVGHDFAMGRNREGTGDWLGFQIETTVVPAFEADGHRVSSSAIRRAVEAGDVEGAHRWLGRSFALDGTVVHGEQVGRTLGFPTADLSLDSRQVLPKVGIYGGRASTPFGEFAAATSVGYRPTFGAHGLTIEAFLLDYSGGSLYGRSMSLSFDHYLRGEESFESVEALQRQMQVDVEAVRRQQ